MKKLWIGNNTLNIVVKKVKIVSVEERIYKEEVVKYLKIEKDFLKLNKRGEGLLLLPNTVFWSTLPSNIPLVKKWILTVFIKSPTELTRKEIKQLRLEGV